MKRNQLFVLALGAALAAGSSHGAPHAHEHGAARLEVVVDGERLDIALKVPLDSVIGFERAPRSAAEQRDAAQALEQLRRGEALFQPDAAAQCTLAETKVEGGVLEPGAKPKAGEHADVDAEYRFKCARPDQLRALAVSLFDTFKRLRRIEVQVAASQGQHKARLVRPARSVSLRR